MSWVSREMGMGSGGHRSRPRTSPRRTTTVRPNGPADQNNLPLIAHPPALPVQRKATAQTRAICHNRVAENVANRTLKGAQPRHHVSRVLIRGKHRVKNLGDDPVLNHPGHPAKQRPPFDLNRR